MPRVLLTSAFLLLALPHAALAEGDPSAGRVKAYTCTGCHGIPGYKNAYPTYNVPKLGGQNATYLIAALNEYRSGERKHKTMNPQAQSLSTQDIEDIAAWFASQGQQSGG